MDPKTIPPLAAQIHLNDILDAWTIKGANPDWHNQMKEKVRDCMPMLAHALDAAADMRSRNRDGYVY